jgi:phytoene dehydrogenase-like protein
MSSILIVIFLFSFSGIASSFHGSSLRLTPVTLRSTPVNNNYHEASESVQLESSKALASEEEADFVVIGAGIGGLSCAALLSQVYGYKVLVLESHYHAGGVAHAFERGGFKFDAGPSLWNGMNQKPWNPLREVLELVGEGDTIKYGTYDGWVMHVPEGSFKFQVGKDKFLPVLEKFGGPEAVNEFRALERELLPLQALAGAVPPLCLRGDAGVALTLLPHYFKLLAGLPAVGAVEGPFKSVSQKVVKDEFLENWLEFLSFALSGLPADSTIAAAVAYTMRDLHQEGARLDYPMGGSGAVVDALLRGVTKGGVSKVLLNTHVESIVLESGRATGVRVRVKGQGQGKGKVLKAKRAVISNASIWDTVKLLQASPGSEVVMPKSVAAAKLATPRTGSFVHLHLGIDATGLPADLESHYSVINKWRPIDAEQNHVIISIPSTLDPSLAPPGCHVIHAYAAANEPFELWADGEGEGNRFPSKADYEAYKKERCDFLWKAIERSIPDVRQRAKVVLQGSPLTHARFNRRFKGTFGPALRAGEDRFPFPKDAVSVPGLLMCGDSVFPGLGVPAVAASGANAASSAVSVDKHLKMLQQLYRLKAE